MSRYCFLVTSLLLFSILGSHSSLADDWPHWRGPDRNDQSKETGLLKEWPKAGPEQIWINKDSGLGYAGFAIADGKLLTMGLEQEQEFGLCLDAETGKEIWRSPVGPRFQNGWGDGPRSTPSIDGGQVYFMNAAGQLTCLDVANGDQKWSVKMSDFGGKVPKWGYAESPLVDGDRVYCTPGGAEGTMLALDKQTGEKIWQTEPVTMTLGEGKQSKPAVAHYSSILPIDWNGQRQLVQLTVLAAIGVDTETGTLLWQIDFPGRVAVIPSPIFDDGKVYVTAGYGIGSKLIQLNSEGQAEEVWFDKSMQNHHGGVIKQGDYIYGYSAKSFVCQDLATGARVWSQRKVKKGAVSYADGLFYYVQEKDGKVMLFQADETTIKLKGQFVLDPQTKRRKPSGRVWVHPVISNGRMYLRDQEIIYCYDIKESEPADGQAAERTTED